MVFAIMIVPLVPVVFFKIGPVVHQIGKGFGSLTAITSVRFVHTVDKLLLR